LADLRTASIVTTHAPPRSAVGFAAIDRGV